jgi:hypothetical protein
MSWLEPQYRNFAEDIIPVAKMMIPDTLVVICEDYQLIILAFFLLGMWQNGTSSPLLNR